MEGGDLVVVDISSDEDAYFTNTSADNYGWIDKVTLDNNDEPDRHIEGVDDDYTDVVMIREVLANTIEGDELSNRAKLGLEEEDDDDDCIVLEGDPDKLVTEVKETEDSSDGSDDVLIVAEKGPVACRDFPHPRHLCVTFPFSSSPRESHCDLCHCYVCDSVAPCAFWGAGTSGSGHCNATDKEEFWKLERQRARGENATPLPGPDMPAVTFSQHNSASPLMQNSAPCNQVLPSAPNYNMFNSHGHPNIISQARVPRPVFSATRRSFQQHMASQQLLSPCANSVPRHRHHSVSSHPGFKRPRFPRRVLGANQFTYSSSRSVESLHSQTLAGCHGAANTIQRFRAPLPATRPPAVSNWEVQHTSHHMDMGQVYAPAVPRSYQQGYGHPAVLPSEIPYVGASGFQAEASCEPTFPHYGSNFPDCNALPHYGSNFQNAQISQPPFVNDSQPRAHIPVLDFLQEVLPMSSTASIGGLGGGGQEQWLHEQSYTGALHQEALTTGAAYQQTELPVTSGAAYQQTESPVTTGAAYQQALSPVTTGAAYLQVVSPVTTGAAYQQAVSPVTTCAVQPRVLAITPGSGQATATSGAAPHQQMPPGTSEDIVLESELDKWLFSNEGGSSNPNTNYPSLIPSPDIGMSYGDFGTSWEGLAES